MLCSGGLACSQRQPGVRAQHQTGPPASPSRLLCSVHPPWRPPRRCMPRRACSASYSAVAVAAFSAMPWSLLSKGVQDLAAAADGACRDGCKRRRAGVTPHSAVLCNGIQHRQPGPSAGSAGCAAQHDSAGPRPCYSLASYKSACVRRRCPSPPLCRPTAGAPLG